MLIPSNLVDEAADSNHCKAGVLELGKLIAAANRTCTAIIDLPCSENSNEFTPEGRLVGRQVERIEAEVARGTATGEHGALLIERIKMNNSELNVVLRISI